MPASGKAALPPSPTTRRPPPPNRSPPQAPDRSGAVLPPPAKPAPDQVHVLARLSKAGPAAGEPPPADEEGDRIKALHTADAAAGASGDAALLARLNAVLQLLADTLGVGWAGLSLAGGERQMLCTRAGAPPMDAAGRRAAFAPWQATGGKGPQMVVS